MHKHIYCEKILFGLILAFIIAIECQSLESNYWQTIYKIIHNSFHCFQVIDQRFNFFLEFKQYLF